MSWMDIGVNYFRIARQLSATSGERQRTFEFPQPDRRAPLQLYEHSIDHAESAQGNPKAHFSARWGDGRLDAGKLRVGGSSGEAG